MQVSIGDPFMRRGWLVCCPLPFLSCASIYQHSSVPLLTIPLPLPSLLYQVFVASSAGLPRPCLRLLPGNYILIFMLMCMYVWICLSLLCLLSPGSSGRAIIKLYLYLHLNLHFHVYVCLYLFRYVYVSTYTEVLMYLCLCVCAVSGGSGHAWLWLERQASGQRTLHHRQVIS